MVLCPRAWTLEADSQDSRLTHETVGLGFLACQMGKIVMATSVGCARDQMRQGLWSRSH